MGGFVGNRDEGLAIDLGQLGDETGGMNAIIVTTTNSIEGRQIAQYLGIVRGIAVRVPTIGQGFQAIGQVLSGNMQAGADMYADLCEAARAQAYSRLVEHAQTMGADAVIAMRFTSTTVAESAAEILAYGTAVKLQP
ncbi:MAG: YbjQ family protein [Pirellulaceae bacterium]